MNKNALRAELEDFYFNKVWPMADLFKDKIFNILDAQVRDDMTSFQRKSMQYQAIADNCSPILFPHSPFYHELGTMMAHCDGDGDFRGILHAGGWNYERYHHIFEDIDPEYYKKRLALEDECFYLICGPYCDTRQHFQFSCKYIFDGGLKSAYDRAEKQLENAQNDEEKDFLKAVKQGLLCLKQISEKFSLKADELLQAELSKADYDPETVENYRRIKESAAVVPWNKPRTFYEALNVLAFIRTCVGALEGIGYNSLGQIDSDLYPFYEADLAAGRLTKDEARELIRAFLLTWDCHYDHDMPMIGYSDHELENTYTLGGVDKDGNIIWNDLTKMFIEITQEEKIIFPKVTYRYSANSPEDYLEAISADVVNSTSVEIFQNDDATIPALVAAGYTLEEAREYLIHGCWDLTVTCKEKHDCGNYVNPLRMLEVSAANRTDIMEKCGLYLKSYDGAKTWEEFYGIILENTKIFLEKRQELTHFGKPYWTSVDPLPLTSTTYEGCIENRKDLTAGGAKYHNEVFMFTGFPNVIDALVAVKTLCYDKKKYTIDQLLAAVRNNWENAEDIRADILKCPGWGDGSDESNAMAKLYHDDMFRITEGLKTLWDGGKVKIGHLGYTELRWWGEKTPATLDGRRSGDYMCQGLTPSRLRRVDSVTAPVHSLTAIEKTQLEGNSVINIVLPSTRMTVQNCAAFLRATSYSSMGSLQLNCVSKAELLDAQIHPENHKNLIVRVCGFSARFTALSPDWQKEFLTRNFYD